MKPGEGFAIFCEDVRRDVMNMNSLIGVFPGDIVFRQQFPNTMPKLGIMMSVYLDAERPPKSFTIVISGSWSDEPVAEFDVESEDDDIYTTDPYLARYPRDELSQFDGRVRAVTIYTVLPLLEIPAEGMLRIVSIVDGNQYLLGRKYVRSSWKDDDDEESADDDEMVELVSD